jgi:hypothetical protein
MNPQDEEFLASLVELRERDPDLFMQMVLESLKRFPDLAVEDGHDFEHKRRALDQMLKHFESQEKYEDCAFIRDLRKKIDDEEKRGLPSNE